jgi:polyisoprenoid-binding protein YceI
MENTWFIGFLALGLAGFAIWAKAQQQHTALLSSLFVMTTVLVMATGFGNNPAGQQLTYISVALIALHWLLSRFMLRSWTVVFGILGTGIYLLFAKQVIPFDDYDLAFTRKDALILPFAGAVLPVLMRAIARLLAKWFPVDAIRIEQAATVFGIGILCLLGLTFGSLYGILLIAIGYHSSQLYLRPKGLEDYRFTLALAALAYIGHFVKTAGIPAEHILQGSTLIGLFAGAGAVAWITLFENKSTQLHFLKKGIVVILPLALLVFFISNELVKEHTGGIPAYAGIIVGLALTSFWVNLNIQPLLLALIAWITAFGLAIAPELKPAEALTQVNPKLAELTPKTGTTETTQVASPLDLPGLKLAEAAGTWKIFTPNSKVSFELGPEGTRTKGLFKTVTGKVKIPADETQTTFDIHLPLKGLSTFNTYRDESLLSADYFNAEKYPEITFASKKVTVKDDTYTLTGTFTMLGKSQTLDIPMKLVKQGVDKGKDYLIFVGAASLDRTKHGMTPDAKIGNIVDFQFEIECRK